MDKTNGNDFVTVFLEGLMISCFNTDQKRFESAILRKSDHDFSVRIVKYRNGESVEDRVYTDLPLEGLRFDFESTSGNEVDGISRYEPGGFTRSETGQNDPHDLRWLVDLEGEEFHAEKLRPTGESASTFGMPLNFLTIRNAEFYVSGITGYENERVEMDAENNVLDRSPFGRYGFIMGARLNADTVKMQVSGTSLIPGGELERSEGFTYRIFVTNTRKGGDEESELPVYYKVLKADDGRHFTLERTAEAEVELYWKTGNCGKILLGRTGTVEDLS